VRETEGEREKEGAAHVHLTVAVSRVSDWQTVCAECWCYRRLLLHARAPPGAYK
jgi:hypothetical protein